MPRRGGVHRAGASRCAAGRACCRGDRADELGNQEQPDLAAVELDEQPAEWIELSLVQLVTKPNGEITIEDRYENCEQPQDDEERCWVLENADVHRRQS